MASHGFNRKKGPRVGIKFQAEIPSLVIGQYRSRIGQNIERFSKFQSTSTWHKTGADSYLEGKIELHQSRKNALLPGLSVAPTWTNIEKDCFLLSLYLLGKDFKLIKKFVGSKNIGDIMFYYYGIFYKSKERRRWAKCWKSKTMNFEMFKGYRQQELLKRLFSYASGNCKTVLHKISDNFKPDKISVAEYVLALKDIFGVELLIAVVGVGRNGKLDLTSTVYDPEKTQQTFSPLLEIPTAKVNSSLTPAQIVKTLTSSCRLTKSRANGLFWEGVWPRLLANGWHFEQSTEYVPPGSKPQLVFLVPGVKSFSTRKLVNGDHYFDSISDVLSKVASEPGLLETKILTIDGSEDRQNREDKQHLDGVLIKQQPSCLLSLSSKGKIDLTKFTIVDTSMVYGIDQSKVTQLRSLPCSSGSKKNTSQDSEDLVEGPCLTYPIIEDQRGTTSCPVEFFDHEDIIDSSPSTPIHNAFNASKAVENHTYHSGLHNDKKKQKSSAYDHGESRNRNGSTSVHRNVNSNEPISHSEASRSIPNMNIAVRTTENLMAGNALIDLNLPEVPQKLPEVAIRRESTRNRALTIKAMDALENGFLSARRREKSQNLPPII